MSDAVCVNLTIENELGLHARAATILVQKACEFESSLYISNNEREVNGKSIMGVLLLQTPKGETITVRAEGPDAQDLVNAITELVESKFGE